MRPFIWIFALLCAARVASSALSLEFSPSAVTVRGATPRSEVVFFAVARQPRGYHVRVIPLVRSQADDDGDGVLRLSVPVEPRSVWAAVDVATGMVVTAAPAGYDFERMTLSRETLRRDNVGQVKKLALPNQAVELLLVRPRTGAWSGTFDQGGPRDDDGRNDGALLADPSRLTPLGNAPAPDHLRNGDIIVIIDIDTMAILSLEVGP